MAWPFWSIVVFYFACLNHFSNCQNASEHETPSGDMATPSNNIAVPACVTSLPQHLIELTGEALYHQILKDQVAARNSVRAAAVIAASQNDTNPGFFLSLTLSIGVAAKEVDQARKGTYNLTESQCLSSSTRFAYNFLQVQDHGHDPLENVVGNPHCPELTGDPLYQYVLEQQGLILKSIQEIADDPVNKKNPSPGPLLTAIFKYDKALRGLHRMVAAGTAGGIRRANCIPVTTAFAVAFGQLVNAGTT